MIDSKISQVLKDLIVALQVAKIYTVEHPKFNEVLSRLFASLKGVLQNKGELIVGIVGEELAFEEEIFFDLSKKMKRLIKDLKVKGVERIVFLNGLSQEELSKFIHCLISPQHMLKQSPQDYLSSAGVRYITVSRIQRSDLSSDSQVKESVSYLQYYEDSLERVSDTLKNVLTNVPVDPLELKFTMNEVMDNLLGRHQEFLKLTAIKKKDLTTFIHMLNVSILAMHFSSKLGYKKEDVLDIGVAALFHDIGKIYLSGLIKKAGALTADEFSRVKSHTVLGSEILLQYIDALGILPSVVAFEHHLHFDLKGYPRTRFIHKPHPISFIVSVCDVYDALLGRRSYKNDYPPLMVYEIMTKERGKLFEPQLIDQFFKYMGVWSIGTIVELSNSKVAIVRSQSKEDIFLPIVEIVPDGDGSTIDLFKEKDNISITRFLNPLKDGQPYVQYI